MKLSFVQKHFNRDNYSMQEGKIKYDKEDVEVYLCKEDGNTSVIDKDRFMILVQQLNQPEVITLKNGVVKLDIDYTILLKQLDDECRATLGNNYFIELNVFKISKLTYMAERNICEDYFLGRYEIYVSVVDKDEKGKEFSIFEFADGFLNDIGKLVESIRLQIGKLQQTREQRRKPHILKDGKYTCVLSNYFSASIIHECIGHLSEMDVHKKYMKISNDKNDYECLDEVVIRDIGNVDENSGPVPCPMNYDDEGNECRNADIFCNRKFGIPLTNELVAAEEKIQNTGNARVGYLKSKNMIRMRNTYLKAGDNTLDELIHSIDKGLFLVYPDIACVLPNSYFEMKVLTGFWIESGRITSSIETIYVHSNTRQLLNSISMISDNMKWFGTRCFKKGEEIYCGAGSPMIKADLFVTHESLIESLIKGNKVYKK